MAQTVTGFGLNALRGGCIADVSGMMRAEFVVKTRQSLGCPGGIRYSAMIDSGCTGNPLALPRLKPSLCLMCVLADFSGFVVVFAVSRGLAEQNAELWYPGLAACAHSHCR